MPTNPHYEAVEQQVCSLELATKLKQLGIEQKSLFYWAKFFYLEGKSHQWGVEAKEQNELEAHEYGHTKIEDVENYSAFTVAEIGEMLPQILKIKKIKYQLFISVAMDKKWFVVYADETDYHNNAPIKFMICNTMANAMAEMLVYLIEHNLYDPQTQK